MKKFMIVIISVLLIAFISVSYSAVTKYITDVKISDFESGKLKNLSISSLGHVSLSPKVEEIHNKSELYIWSSGVGKDGNLYFCSGDKGIIYVKKQDGKIEQFASTSGLQLSSLAFDSEGNLYVTSNPNGEIIKVDSKKNAEVFCKFDEAYIWEIKFDENGNLLACTGGNNAGLYSIDKTGTKKLLFNSKEESHILSFALKGDKIYFGSEGKGILYEFDKTSGSAKVIYQTYEKEISRVIISPDDEVIFCTATRNYIRQFDPSFDYTDPFAKKIVRKKKKTTRRRRRVVRKISKNSIYKYNKQGKIEKIFTKDGNILTSLVYDKDGNLYVGSGDEGNIYKIDKKGNPFIFVNFKQQQVLTLTLDNDKIYAGTGNLGKLYEVSINLANKGELISRVINVKGDSLFGKIRWDDGSNNFGKTLLYFRSGNTSKPDKTWTEWKGPFSDSKGSLVEKNKAKYFQYKIIIQADNPVKAPKLKKVVVPYLLDNRAPIISRLKIMKKKGRTIRRKGKKVSNSTDTQISWYGKDPDGDTLEYAVYYKMKNLNKWFLLSDDDLTTTKFYFDSKQLPDGEYIFKVVVTDSAGNPQDRALKSEIVNEPYIIDNTSPAISDIDFKVDGKYLVFSGFAEDKTSPLKSIEYAINGQQWDYIEPVDKIYDSQKEEFVVKIKIKGNKEISKGKNFIVIRAIEENDNFITKSRTFEMK